MPITTPNSIAPKSRRSLLFRDSSTATTAAAAAATAAIVVVVVPLIDRFIAHPFSLRSLPLHIYPYILMYTYRTRTIKAPRGACVRACDYRVRNTKGGPSGELSQASASSSASVRGGSLSDGKREESKRKGKKKGRRKRRTGHRWQRRRAETRRS